MIESSIIATRNLLVRAVVRYEELAARPAGDYTAEERFELSTLTLVLGDVVQLAQRIDTARVRVDYSSVYADQVAPINPLLRG